MAHCSLAVVADGTSGLLDPRGQRGLGDEPISPDVVEQLFLGDEPSPLLDQVEQHVEDLRFDVADAVGAHDLDAVGVDSELSESVTRH